MEVLFSIGDIAIDKKENLKYRILSLLPQVIVLCQMDVDKLKIVHVDKSIFISLLNNHDMEIIKDESNIIVDDNYLKNSDRRTTFETRLNAVLSVVELYEPEFLELSSKKTKPEVNEIILKSGIGKSCFWRCLRRYLQSGMQKSSLMDKRALGNSKGKTYVFQNKPGRKSDYFEDSGVIMDDVIERYFQEALKDYKSGRQKTLKSVYEKMNNKHFTKTEMVNGVPTMVLLPVFERPTFRQFYYYVQKHLSEEEKAVIKTSKAEVRNDKRLLLSDIMEGVKDPGDMVEIDACEADMSLVSELNSNQSIGRPIVYFMVDVFSRVILAMSVALDNNSVIGVTNLFLNLADDKREYCQKYNFDFHDEKVWPSQIIPRRIRVDRGSEFKSKEFERVCRCLGIEKNIVSGGSGSLKGLVEQTFHQMHVSQNVHLENHGLIEKRHDSQHHLEATLTISQYTRMVINFVITHNQQYLETYRPTKEMVENDIRSIPAELWQYGIEKYGSPRYISNKMQFYYDLMTPKTAKITRKGISFKGLYYVPENDEFMGHQMFTAEKKGESLKIKIDLRDISKIYYTRNNEVFVARLNEHVSGNSEFGCLTMKQWDDYRKKMGKMKMEGKVYNDALLSYRYAVNELIVKNAGKSIVSKQRDMKEARELEKQRIALDNKIAKRITDAEEDSYVDENPKSGDLHQSNCLDSEKTELSEYDKKIEEIKKKKSYELTQEEECMLMKYAIDHFYDE